MARAARVRGRGGGKATKRAPARASAKRAAEPATPEDPQSFEVLGEGD